MQQVNCRMRRIQTCETLSRVHIVRQPLGSALPAVHAQERMSRTCESGKTRVCPLIVPLIRESPNLKRQPRNDQASGALRAEEHEGRCLRQPRRPLCPCGTHTHSLRLALSTTSARAAWCPRRRRHRALTARLGV